MDGFLFASELKLELPAYAGPSSAKGETERLSTSPVLFRITNSYTIKLWIIIIMDKIGVAVIGASMRSAMIFDYLRRHSSHGHVVGVYDIIGERADCLIEEYNLSHVKRYSSLDEAINDKKVDAVFVGTPDNAHVAPVVAALEASKHVYCEKPLATTLQDCDAIIDAAQKASSVFYLGMNLRHGPIHETLHELLANGELGKVLTIEANEYYYDGRTYFRRWNRLREFGGGLWITKACHDFDLLNWMAGGKPVRVFATSSLSHYKPIADGASHCRICKLKDHCKDYYDIECTEIPLWDRLGEITEKATGQMRDMCLFNADKDTFDNGIAVVEYDNDIRATYTVNVVSARSTRQMNILGTEGAAEADMESGFVNVYRRHSQHKIVHDLKAMMASGHGGADDRILGDFFRCCRTGDKPRSSWDDGRLGVLVGLMARESADTGKPITIR